MFGCRRGLPSPRRLSGLIRRGPRNDFGLPDGQPERLSDSRDHSRRRDSHRVAGGLLRPSRVCVHLGRAKGRRPHPGPARSDAGGRQVRLAAVAGRRDQADPEGRPGSRCRRPHAVSAGPLHRHCRLVRRIPVPPVQRRLGRRLARSRTVPGPGDSFAGSAGHHSGRLLKRLEVVAVRWHAGSRPDGQLRSTAGHHRGHSGADCRAR